MHSALRTAIMSDPIDQWARGSLHAWDWTSGRGRWNGTRIRATSTPGLTYTRADAQNAYATSLGGVLLPYVTGQLRRVEGRGVLIEGARTNRCLQSQALATTPWIATNSGTGVAPTVTNNYAVAPDGTTTASRVQCSLAGGTASADQSLCAQVLTGTTCWGSFYLKTNDGTTKVVYLRAGSATSVTVTGTWQRFDFDAGTLAATQFAVGLRGAQGLTNSDSVDLLVWGAQLEAAAFPSSYIPTTTASATRAADVLTVPVSGIDYPLTLFAEFERVVDTGGSESLFQVDNGGANDETHLFVASNDRLNLVVKTGGVTQANINPTGAIAIATVTKFAARAQTNSAQIARNGSLGTEVTTVTVPASPTRANFNRTDVLSFGYLRRAAIWTRALTDGELTAVTSG